MKTTEVNRGLIGRRCEYIFTGLMVTGVVEDTAAWGVCSLRGWVNSYESVRFVAIDDHTAVITGEYNFEQEVWLEKNIPIKRP